MSEIKYLKSDRSSMEKKQKEKDNLYGWTEYLKDHTIDRTQDSPEIRYIGVLEKNLTRVETKKQEIDKERLRLKKEVISLEGWMRRLELEVKIRDEEILRLKEVLQRHNIKYREPTKFI